jgi:hypothetical protein
VSASLPSPDLRARVIAAAGREPVRTRAAGARRRVAALALGFASVGAIAAALGGPATKGRPVAYVVTLAVAWLVVAAAATWVGVARGRSMLGRSAAWRFVVVALTPVALLATWLPVALGWPQTLSDASGIQQHAICNAVTILFATGPLVAFALVRRGDDPVRPRLTGAAIGAAAGAWGAVALVLFCEFTGPLHILVGHAMPVLLIAVLGVLIGDRVVAVRAKTG